jgi:hypothetical protein
MEIDMGQHPFKKEDCSDNDEDKADDECAVILADRINRGHSLLHRLSIGMDGFRAGRIGILLKVLQGLFRDGNPEDDVKQKAAPSKNNKKGKNDAYNGGIGIQ